MARSIHDDDELQDAQELAAGFSRRTLVIIVGILVVMGSVGALLIVYTVDEGQALSVDLTAPSRNDDILTFAYTIHTERAGASGPATFSVVHEGTVEHTRTVTPEGGGGRVDIRFRDFVVGNGDYEFRLDYKGVRGTTNYTIGTPDRTNFIVTALRVDATSTWVGSDLHTGAIQFSLWLFSDIDTGVQAQAPPNASFTLQVNKNGFPDGLPVLQGVEGKAYVSRILNVSLGPGNYTVDLTFTNQWVKDTAAIKTLTGTNKTFVHNKPRACVVGSPYHGNNANNFTITADASCSTDDIAIVQYNWAFGDSTPIVTNNAIPTETHQFPASTLTRSYTGSVEVIDSNGESDFASFTVTTAST